MFKKFISSVKRTTDKVLKNAKAAVRLTAALAAIPVIGVMAATQKTVAGPVFHNYSAIPKLFHKMMCGILGIKVEFSKDSVPLEKNKDTRVWKVYNHLSSFDPFVIGSEVKGSFVGKGELLKNPVFSWIAPVANFIGVRRRREFNQQSRAKIIENFNRGFDTQMFPEGTTVHSGEVKLFHAGLPELLYEGKAIDKNGREVALEKDVVMQPFALRVKKVDGQPVGTDPADAESDRLRRLYCDPAPGRGELTKLWKRLQMDMTLELTALPALEPAAFADAKELVNQAALEVASVINPGQTTFEKARIPYPQAAPQNP